MKKILILTMMGLLVMSTAVFAQNVKEKAQMRKMMVERVEKEKAVDILTEEQKTTVKGLKLDLQKKRIKIEADLKLAKLELKEFMVEGAASVNQIKAKLENVKKFEVDLQMENIKFRNEFNSILTDEQKAKFKELRKNRVGKGIANRGNMRGRRGGNGFGGQGMQRMRSGRGGNGQHAGIRGGMNGNLRMGMGFGFRNMGRDNNQGGFMNRGNRGNMRGQGGFFFKREMNTPMYEFPQVVEPVRKKKNEK